MGGCFKRGSRPASPTRILVWARLVLCRRRLSRCHGAHGTLRGIGPGINPRAHQRRPASGTSGPAAVWGHCQWAWPSLADSVGPRPQGHRKDARGWEPPRKRPFAENRGLVALPLDLGHTEPQHTPASPRRDQSQGATSVMAPFQVRAAGVGLQRESEHVRIARAHFPR
jgi:hypothetical protein